MIDKINFWKKIFNDRILKNHIVDKNKSKMFIIYSDNNKLNWILFRNIFTRSHHHFKLVPIMFITDTLGFEDFYNDDPELNPINPTFNFFTDVERNMSKEEYIHTEIDNLTYTVWWDGLDHISKSGYNQLLFTTSLEELNKMITIGKKNEQEVVVFYFKNKKTQEIFLTEENKKKYKTTDIWTFSYNPKILKRWESKKLWDVIKERLYFKYERKLKKLRNPIWMIMNQYYKYSVIPSFIDDEDLYQTQTDSIERIEGLYERQEKK